MTFSIVVIARNEEKTLPRLIESLREFKDRGGEIVVVDTGSSDNTVKIAKENNCNVFEIGTIYRHTITREQAEDINRRFIVDESDILKEGDTYFDFASARNHAASLANNDYVSYADADEIFTKLDIDKIEQFIKEGWEQFEYNFVYAHDGYGRETIKFVQSKFYDRRKVKWTGIIHEVLQGQAKIKFLDESIFKLEHYQNVETNRQGYLRGLAIDCFEHQDKDRNSHYFARELMWNGRPKSAIKEFERHIKMNGWTAEKAQSMIFMGDCYGMIGKPDEQVEWYNKAFYIDCSRREALIKLARFYKHNNNPQSCAVYAKGALEIPWNAFYANDVKHYQDEPYALLYWAMGWLGRIDEAREYLIKAMSYDSMRPDYLRDTKYYFEYPDQGIDGWMTFEELTFLYEMAKKMDTICEVGSWKGRSTHALLSGCKGTVTAIDTWKGSADPLDWTHNLAKQSDIFAEFKRNVGKFKNLKIIEGKSAEVAKTIDDKTYDVVFVDAGHTYEEVREDIRAWKSKAKIMLCGHDYFDTVWMGVCRAVDEELGGPDEIHGTIWVKYLI